MATDTFKLLWQDWLIKQDYIQNPLTKKWYKNVKIKNVEPNNTVSNLKTWVVYTGGA